MTDYKLFDRRQMNPYLKYKNWRDLKMGMFDLETTGVNPFNRDSTKVVQFCCKIVQRTGNAKSPKEIATMNVLVNPERTIPEGASNIHKITDPMVADQPTFEEHSEEIWAFLNECDLLVAYNGLSFDVPLLCREFFDAGFVSAPDLFSDELFCLDPLVFHRREMGKFSGVTLINAAIEYNCQGIGSVAHGEFDMHNALIDVEMMERVTWEMKHIMPWSLDECSEKQRNLWIEQEEYLNNKWDDRYNSSVERFLGIPMEEWDSRHDESEEEDE